MKKLIITSALFAFAAAPVFAQSAQQVAAPQPAQSSQMNRGPRAEAIAERQAKTYKQQYNLTDKQYTDVYQACLEFAKNMEDKRSSGQQMKPQDFQEMMAKRNGKFKTIMTAEQYKAFEATQAPRMQQAPPPAKKG